MTDEEKANAKTPGVNENLNDDSSTSLHAENVTPTTNRAIHTNDSINHNIDGDNITYAGDNNGEISSKYESNEAPINGSGTSDNKSSGSLVVSENVYANEMTSLLDSSSTPNGKDAESLSTYGDTSETLSDTAERHLRFLDEMDRPWPATFERSISLLAGPTMNTTFIDQVTRSPKVTPNLPMRAKVIYMLHCTTFVMDVLT